ncbi:MAG: hypothetical protein MK138_14365, partial [Planctomycetes bacterium]|nr:hypothetical protein [Planctomycetota bacterium]MCH2585942.1 hypothetical protein [Planctomycetota bacterium]
ALMEYCCGLFTEVYLAICKQLGDKLVEAGPARRLVPGELRNLALLPSYRERLRKLRAATVAELKRTGAAMADALPAVGTPE